MSTNSKFCFERAAESGREAEEAQLDNVRDRCLRSQAVWLAMAERMLVNENRQQKRAGAVAIVAEDVALT